MSKLSKILGYIVIIVGTLLLLYYVGISDPVTNLEQFRAMIFIIISILSYCHYGTYLIYQDAYGRTSE